MRGEVARGGAVKQGAAMAKESARKRVDESTRKRVRGEVARGEAVIGEVVIGEVPVARELSGMWGNESSRGGVGPWARIGRAKGETGREGVAIGEVLIASDTSSGGDLVVRGVPRARQA